MGKINRILNDLENHLDFKFLDGEVIKSFETVYITVKKDHYEFSINDQKICLGRYNDKKDVEYYIHIGDFINEILKSDLSIKTPNFVICDDVKMNSGDASNELLMHHILSIVNIVDSFNANVAEKLYGDDISIVCAEKCTNLFKYTTYLRTMNLARHIANESFNISYEKIVSRVGPDATYYTDYYDKKYECESVKNHILIKEKNEQAAREREEFVRITRVMMEKIKNELAAKKKAEEELAKKPPIRELVEMYDSFVRNEYYIGEESHPYHALLTVGNLYGRPVPDDVMSYFMFVDTKDNDVALFEIDEESDGYRLHIYGYGHIKIQRFLDPAAMRKVIQDKVMQEFIHHLQSDDVYTRAIYKKMVDCAVHVRIYLQGASTLSNIRFDNLNDLEKTHDRDTLMSVVYMLYVIMQKQCKIIENCGYFKIDMVKLNFELIEFLSLQNSYSYSKFRRVASMFAHRWGITHDHIATFFHKKIKSNHK